MPESTAALYDGSATKWQRAEPILLSDFTARPFLLDWCDPVRGLDILDLGCGEGYVGRQLLERGAASVTGMDISAEMVENARAQIPTDAGETLTYSVGDATDLERFATDSFDLVACVFLFNYLDSAQTTAAMTEVARVLRPGGRFVFAVPHPSLAFMRPEEAPFYFSRGGRGYFEGRDALFEGEIWRRDGVACRVRCVHKTLDDYFRALREAGFTTLPELKELHATEEHMEFDPAFFEPLRETPLHLAFRLTL
ncbi:MAG: class I SAM-dependent methyltransferase [Planctomycetota bacterium]